VSQVAKDFGSPGPAFTTGSTWLTSRTASARVSPRLSRPSGVSCVSAQAAGAGEQSPEGPQARRDAPAVAFQAELVDWPQATGVPSISRSSSAGPGVARPAARRPAPLAECEHLTRRDRRPGRAFRNSLRLRRPRTHHLTSGASRSCSGVRRDGITQQSPSMWWVTSVKRHHRIGDDLPRIAHCQPRRHRSRASERPRSRPVTRSVCVSSTPPAWDTMPAHQRTPRSWCAFHI
jgi:hypothetical protein